MFILSFKMRLKSVDASLTSFQSETNVLHILVKIFNDNQIFRQLFQQLLFCKRKLAKPLLKRNVVLNLNTNLNWILTYYQNKN